MTYRLPAIWHLFDDDGVAPRLLVLAKMIERTTSRQLQRGFGISVAQWRVLAFVCISGPASASSIGEAAEVDQAEISRAVKALIADGLVARDYEPGSRKTMVIAPTQEGTALFTRIRERRRSYFAAITRALEGEARTEFGRTLTAIAGDVVAERDSDRTGRIT
jgi:DNA-binding MarR family transcriptional regulator